MKRSTTSFLAEYALVALAVLAASARPAHAYLDPGTGSYAFQVGVAGVFGALFSMKMFWARLRKGLTTGRYAAENKSLPANAAAAPEGEGVGRAD